MKIKTIRWISGIAVIGYAAMPKIYDAFRRGDGSLGDRVLTTATLLFAGLLFFALGASWRCPACKKYTIIFGRHCVRCGARLAPDDEGIWR